MMLAEKECHWGRLLSISNAYIHWLKWQFYDLLLQIRVFVLCVIEAIFLSDHVCPPVFSTVV
jgi:hypothetical protein